MLLAQAPLPDFDEIVRDVSPARRAAAVRKLGALFAESAQQFNAQHVALFDGILKGLLVQADSYVRADLADRLASLINAPPSVVRELVHDDEITVSGPLLRASPLIDEATLIEIARLRGQLHLLAISQRAAISEIITDIILRRGDREVVRSVAGNLTAVFSVPGYLNLVQRAADDGLLAVVVGQRQDLSAPLLQQLLSESVDLVRRKIFQAANPARKAVLARTMVDMVTDGEMPGIRHGFAAARTTDVDLYKAGEIDQEALAKFARERKFDETVAVLAAISGLTIDAVAQIISGGKRDPILILGRALGIEWTAVRPLLALRLALGRNPSATDVEEARVSFERLALSTAQRMMKFWKDRAQA